MAWLGEWIRERPALRAAFRRIKSGYLRWRLGLRSTDPSFYLGGRADIASDLRAGPYSYVGRDCCICPRVSIGKYTYLAHEVSIQGGDHRHDLPGTPIGFSGRPEMPETSIGDDVWIGHRAIVMAGVTIGDAAVVGAGAVVTRDVEPFAIVGGVPAEQIGQRFNSDAERELHRKMLAEPARAGALPETRVPGTGQH